MTTWRPIPGWTGLYEASSDGQIRSLDRLTINGRRVKGRTLKSFPQPKGYQIVVLARDGGRFAFALHRLIAETFLGPKPDGMVTCHNDGDKNNNAAANLRYDTTSANELDKVAHGANTNSNKTHCPQGHPYDEVNTHHRPNQGRKCRTCHREAKRAYDARKRAERTAVTTEDLAA